MNDKKKSFRQKTEDFLSGRGFYIALSACVLVIGISAWTLLASGALADRTDVAADSNTMAGTVEKDDAQETITVPMIDRTPKPKDDETEKPEDTTDTGNTDTGSTETDSTETGSAETMVPDNAPPEETVETMAPQDEPSAPLKFAWPVFGEVDVGYFADELVYNKTMMDWRTHSAIDIAAGLGDKVMACAKGTVTAVYEDALLGTVVIIDHGDGLESIYANLAATPTVSEGDEVTSATVIGAVGDTAIGETGQPYHLHFAMTKDGESVDPTEYLP